MEAVCANLSPSVTRLCLASSGMAVDGAAAVAKMLRSDLVATFGNALSHISSRAG